MARTVPVIRVALDMVFSFTVDRPGKSLREIRVPPRACNWSDIVNKIDPVFGARHRLRPI